MINLIILFDQKIILSEEAIKLMNEQDPSTFCTIEFFEHELQTTPRLNGPRPEYNFTAQYVVKVDDFFLHYLQKETVNIEMHQAIGSDYETRAVCQLSFRDLLDKQVPRIHGSARLTCVNSGVSFGAIEYWARLIMPFDEAFRLYKERTKTLGYISSNKKAAQQHESQMAKQKAKAASNMNELNVNILRCAKITTIGNKSQPSPYCVYKFYDFKDHDTEIIPASNYPEFNDHKAFAVPMDIDLDKYLKQQMLEVYVFDDSESDAADSLYLGVAKVPLIGLTHDKDIKGTFELKRADGTTNGTLDIALYWQYSYLPPSACTFAASGSKQPVGDKAGQHVVTQMGSLAQKAQKMGVKLPKTMPEAEAKPSKRNSVCSESSIGNATIRQRPDNLKTPSPVDRPKTPQATATEQHFNDTMFGDEQARTYSPNELDSLRSNYQNNLAAAAAMSDDERDNSKSHNIEEKLVSDEEELTQIDDELPTNTLNEYQTTGKSEDGVVIGDRASWDPNDTGKLPKEGNDNCVIIEISSFSFKENSAVLHRDDVKKLFVGMNFLNYDPADLESKSSMPRPAANESVYFNFRKSNHFFSYQFI